MSKRKEVEPSNYLVWVYIIGFVLVSLVVRQILHANNNRRLSDYNNCVQQSDKNTQQAANATVAAGYDVREVNRYTAGEGLRNLEHCSRQRPTDFELWVGGYDQQ
jgi:hypothetical protein